LEGVSNVFADALAGGGIFEALDEFCGSTIVCPLRNESGEIV